MKHGDISSTRISAMLLNALLCLLIGYFAYHCIHGQRGLLAYHTLTKEFAAKKEILYTLEVDKKLMEHKVALINDNNTDMIDELARRKLGLAAPHELVLLLENTDIPKSGK